MMIAERLSRLREHAINWQVSPAERSDHYPCDRYAGPGWIRVLRGIDVDATPAITFRWVCQVKVAPYSYDWIDHRGARSPRTLTPGAEHLEVGQTFLVVEITDFEIGHHITGTATPRAERLFGPLALSYLVRPRADDPERSRLVVCMWVGVSGLPRRVAGEALLWGDLVMMRKQLRTLKACAEATAASG